MHGGAFGAGVGARPQPDGTLLAVQVFVFPDATMTNATVAGTVSRVDGAGLVLSYPGGEQKVTLTPDTTILMAAPAEAAEIKPGAQVAMIATRQTDESSGTSPVTIAKGGAKLPC
ncbi:hypothetical protein [Bosea sp. TND4EK4]|uniref:hypothetical protein n=1 Tax=Bosea sp. TND4EK4 TaxID=1907408 RepID=UPI0009554746|nr:hypothetical protein [Bosea sp. TND4EK4]SIQ33758.1 hypothetical protein SAMN05880592_102441 [Bosea sp. TND4EK4]